MLQKSLRLKYEGHLLGLFIAFLMTPKYILRLGPTYDGLSVSFILILDSRYKQDFRKVKYWDNKDHKHDKKRPDSAIPKLLGDGSRITFFTKILKVIPIVKPCKLIHNEWEDYANNAQYLKSNPFILHITQDLHSRPEMLPFNQIFTWITAAEMQQRQVCLFTLHHTFLSVIYSPPPSCTKHTSPLCS